MIPISMVILGAPGLGKSTLAGSVCELEQVDKCLLIVAKPGEEKSFMYQRHGLTEKAELYYDADWLPTLSMYKADSYLRLLRRIEELRKDTEYDAVIIDPGTDVAELISHHILAPYKVGSYGDLPNTQSYFAQLADKAREFIGRANLLSTPIASKPKFVLIPFHTQPPKEGMVVNLGQGMKEKQQSADQKAAGIEYEGMVLPQIEGKYRRKLLADIDCVVYCDIETKRQLDPKTKKMVEVVEHQIQVVPNKDRHSKIRIAPTLAGQMIPNNMKALLEAVEESQR